MRSMVRYALPCLVLILLLSGHSLVAKTTQVQSPNANPVLAVAKKCGINSDSIQVVDDRTLDANTYLIEGESPKLSEISVHCLVFWNVTKGNFITFSSPLYEKIRQKTHDANSQILGTLTASSWLSGAKLLGKFQPYAPKTMILKEYLTSIEKMCGIKAGTALELTAEKSITLIPFSFTELNEQEPNESEWRFGCVLQSMTLANLTKHGISFGFVGNEQLPEEKEQK